MSKSLQVPFDSKILFKDEGMVGECPGPAGQPDQQQVVVT